MRARLLAMARRDDGRSLAVVEQGIFGLTEWGLTQDPAAVEATEPVLPEAGQSLRSLERTPMTLAEKRAAAEAGRSGRFDSEDREARTRSRGRRRRPRKDETTAEALAAILVELGKGPIDLQYVLDALPRQPSLPQGFPSDLEGLLELARTENARRESEGESPRFLLDGDRAALMPVQRPEVVAPAAVETLARRTDSYQAAADQLARTLRGLSPEKLEHVFLELARRHELHDAKVAKRSAKGSPLYTGMLRLGAAQLRVAVRMLTSGREVRADDIDELREDLENYSAGAGVILTMGKVARVARTRSEDMNKKPVLLFDGGALSLACAKAELGVRVRLEQVYEPVPAMLERIDTGVGRGSRS